MKLILTAKAMANVKVSKASKVDNWPNNHLLLRWKMKRLLLVGFNPQGLLGIAGLRP
jgi:hypothetical protein